MLLVEDSCAYFALMGFQLFAYGGEGLAADALGKVLT
jgi:hypothetical protein